MTFSGSPVDPAHQAKELGQARTTLVTKTSSFRMLRFWSLEKFSLNFWSSSFVTRVLNLFHSWPSLSLYGLIQSVWCFFLLSLLILSGFLQFNLENTDLRKVLPTFLYISCVPHREWILHLHWGVTSLQRESLRTAIKFTHLGTEMFSLLLPHARTSYRKAWCVSSSSRTIWRLLDVAKVRRTG